VLCARLPEGLSRWSIGGLLEARDGAWRGSRGGVTAAIVLRDRHRPWFHAVLLLMLGIGLLGAFIVAAYLLDWLARGLALRGARCRSSSRCRASSTSPRCAASRRANVRCARRCRPSLNCPVPRGEGVRSGPQRVAL
jgi:hypothetical protein